MKICPKCHAEIPDDDWNCPKCGYHFISTAVGTGHASTGNMTPNSRSVVSGEDSSIIRDKDHQTSDDDGLSFDADQPYTTTHSSHEDD